ncbi:MAG: HNH endonuclease [Magnetococcales bacterium]|nr:HNH endonuclease [Magnetococcales bacterium]
MPAIQEVPTIKRDGHGHISRSSNPKETFERANPCPSTGKTSGACPGYVVDYMVPLKQGGADAPSNMQWQMVQDAKTKDKWE